MQKVIISFLVGFGVSLILSPLVIKLIRVIKGQQSILDYVDKHKSKQGTLTVGGLIFIFGSFFCYLTFFESDNRLASVALLAMLGFGLLGFLDDFIKIRFKQNLGLRAYQKFMGQVGIGLILGYFIYSSPLTTKEIFIPFTNFSINIGWWLIIFVMLYFVAVSNSVNFIDGLDGLAGGVTFIILSFFTLIIGLTASVSNETIVEIVKAREILNVLILAGGVCGSILAFLCLNSHPAKIFMGDTGSLALGGFLAAIFALTGQYLLLIIMGIMYVVTTLSIVLQVGYYKLTRKRIFKMAPIHHHFEQLGYRETKIVSIYMIITIVICAFSLMMSM